MPAVIPLRLNAAKVEDQGVADFHYGDVAVAKQSYVDQVNRSFGERTAEIASTETIIVRQSSGEQIEDVKIEPWFEEERIENYSFKIGPMCQLNFAFYPTYIRTGVLESYIAKTNLSPPVPILFWAPNENNSQWICIRIKENGYMSILGNQFSTLPFYCVATFPLNLWNDNRFI